MNNNDKVHLIPLKDIRIPDTNVRKTKDVMIPELASSIKKYGLLQPIVLRGEYGKPPYDLILGQRRYLAHKHLEKKEIKAIFQKVLSDIIATILSLSENMHRAELNFVDKARAITSLYKHFDKKVSKVAKETGLSESTIREYIKIEEQASEKMKETSKNKIDMHRALKAAEGNMKKAEEILELFNEYKFSKYDKEKTVDFVRKNPKATKKDIITEVETPRKTETIVLTLSSVIDTALNKAKKELSLERDEVAILAIESWLKQNGFLK